MEKMNDNRVGKNIRRIRKDKGLSHEDLADIMNKSTSFIAKVESGERGQYNNIIYEFMEALDIDANTIFGCLNENSIDAMLAELDIEKQKYFRSIFIDMIVKLPK